MRMTDKEILGLLATGERGTLECKKADKNVPNSLWETYSAFANTNGGVILLGVFEDVAEQEPAKRFKITGVKDADRMCKDLWNTVNSSEKVNVNLLRDGDVQIVRVQGKDVIVVNVPRAECNLRPVFINNNMPRGSFRRGHAGDYRCPEPMTRMMVRDSFDDGNDRLFLEHYNMEDIDIPSLAAYRVMFELRNQGHVNMMTASF